MAYFEHLLLRNYLEEDGLISLDFSLLFFVLKIIVDCLLSNVQI